MISQVLEAPAPEARIEQDPKALARAIVARLTYNVGKDPQTAEPHDWIEAAILTTRDCIIRPWLHSKSEAYRKSEKRVYYLSLEFLIGRLFRDAVSNLGLIDTM
ncbi:MAG TPA: hypothetical protein VK022_00575, partial [Paracoccaceae bacterium]|nr:hypothetical protein [Paracoccaceae bacterium]